MLTRKKNVRCLPRDAAAAAYEISLFLIFYDAK